MGHWYDKEGKPCHTQITASGKNKGGERPTTIRDARKLDLFPSVTTILEPLKGDALTDWKVREALKHAFNLVTDQTAFLFDNHDAFADFAAEQLKEQTSGYANDGTAVHDAVEKSLTIKDHRTEEIHIPHVENFYAALNELRESQGAKSWRLISAEHRFAIPEVSGCRGYGGSMDQLFAFDYGDKSQRWVTDLKCKQTKEGKPFYLSESYGIQAAAYAWAVHTLTKEGPYIDMPRTANILISLTEPGRRQVVIYSEEEQAKNLEMFFLLLKLWYLRNW